MPSSSRCHLLFNWFWHISTNSQWVSWFWFCMGIFFNVHKHKYLFFHATMYLLMHLQLMESNRVLKASVYWFVFSFSSLNTRKSLCFLRSPLKIQFFFSGTWASYLLWYLFSTTAIITHTFKVFQGKIKFPTGKHGEVIQTFCHWEVTCFLENLSDFWVHVLELHISRWVDTNFYGEEALGWLKPR